jgi:hypothetical protein
MFVRIALKVRDGVISSENNEKINKDYIDFLGKKERLCFDIT